MFLFLSSTFSLLADEHNHNVTQTKKAIAVIYPTFGNTAKGTVRFEENSDGKIRIIVQISGLTPGKHGFHIHEFGDCSSNDGNSAGGHFAGLHTQHGSPNDELRHDGDMGNIVADENGNATTEWVDNVMTFDGQNSIIGRGVIVHAKEDDLKTQPTGNAGPRVGCGSIAICK